MHPKLLFIKTRILITSIAEQDLPVAAGDDDAAMYGSDVIVVPIRASRDGYEDISINHEYVERMESVSVIPDVYPCNANGSWRRDYGFSEWYYVDDDDDGPPQSHLISNHLKASFAETVSLFGRKILIINFADEPDDRSIDRLKRRIRQLLGQSSPVLSGARFEAYGFIDTRQPGVIIGDIEKTLDCDEVVDYMLVQPVAMVDRDKSGLSPLSDWLGRSSKLASRRA